ncbi:MAG: lamin tail domain-containing protein, partial [Trichodesmium sp.]
MTTTNLFISEYIEGSSFNKAIEIANFTGSAVNLNGYNLEIYFNGNTSPGTTVSLNGYTIANSDVFVIADDGADAAILAEADLTPTNSFFNGDDAVVLRNSNGEIIDVIGQIGFDPGSEWSGGSIGTQNETLRRLSSITDGDNNGNDSFDPSLEWEGFAQDTFDGLGSHSIDGGGGGTTTALISEFQPNPTGTDPAQTTFELSGTPGDAFDGVIVSIESDSGSSAGRVDRVASVSGTFDANGLLTVDITDLENPSFTVALLSDFTGNTSTDIDTDNDGVADELSTFGTVFDAIGVPDNTGDQAFLYGTDLGGIDFSYTGDEPRLIFRDASVGDLYAVNDPDNGQVFDINGNDVTPAIFDTDPTIGTDTFGTINPTVGDGGDPEPEPTLTPIYDIQGAGHTSALEGQTVTTRGIVTAVDSNGFYLQDAAGDGNDATSDALFVFTSSAPGVTVGDELQVDGTVSEFTPGGTSSRNLSTTQISSPTITNLSSGNALPDAVIIGSGGRVPPTENIDDDAFASFDPTTDGIDLFESLEGMRVTAQNVVAVAPTNRFGEIFTVVDNGVGATGISDRGTLNISPNDFNPEKVQIDEDSGVFDFDFPNVNVGDSLGNVTGVVSYGFGNFEILPTEDFTNNITSANLQPEVSSIVGTSDQLTVASYNVLNLDPNDSDGDTDIANGRFDSIASQIINNLNTPDIIGLQEVQDNSGSVNDGTIAADQTLQTLVDAISTAGGPTYQFIDNTFITDGASGGQPGGNIRTAFLYNPARVDLVDGSVQTIGDQNFGSAFEGARLPLVADFEFNGQEVSVVSNHFSSKGGSAPILGIEQPFDARQEDVTVNGSLDERQAQANAVQGFVADTLTADPDANLVVLGDFNEFEFVSPLNTLEQNLTNLTETEILDEDERYTFIFQGNSQSLDHI